MDLYMDNQLKLIKSGSISRHQITLMSSKEVHETLACVLVIEQLPQVSSHLSLKYDDLTRAFAV